jgi:cobalt-zinc-cadmium efflux system outer membrane protein
MALRRLWAIGLLLQPATLSGQTAAPAEANRLIEQALERNREILAARQRVAETRALLRQAGVRPAATIEASAGTGRPLRTRGEQEYSVAYFLPVETGGKRSGRLAVARRAIEAAEAELGELARQLTYDLMTGFIEAAAARRKLEAVGRISDVNRESLRLVTARVERDDAAPLERRLLLVELNRSESQRALLSGEAEASELELRRTAVIPPAAGRLELALLRPPGISLAAEEIARRALDERPDLRAARALESQASAEVSLARAEGRPDLTLSAEYARRHAQFEDPVRTTASGAALVLQDRDNVLTFGISIPLQTRRRNLGNIEAAAARQNAARLRREQLEAAIPYEVEAAWRRYQAALKSVEILADGVLDESRRNLEVIRQAYNLGQLRLLDVLAEQRRLLETELAVIDAEAELARSRAELERAAGGSIP